LKPKNDYQWSKIVEKSFSDEAFRQHLIAAPKEIMREHGIAIMTGTELKVIEGRFAVIPFPDDIEILQPIDDIYTKIIQCSYSDLEFSGKLLNDNFLFNFSDVGLMNFNLGGGSGSVEGIPISVDDIELGSVSFVEDTINVKHLVLPSRTFHFPDITEWSIKIPAIYPAIYP
jgi:hypothetical protein